MSCTLEELQKTEYEILCKFADFCDKNDIEYILHAGTLIGAIRHNGFIPWDDDIDVMMDTKNFRKLKKEIKKHPIDGMHFTWFDVKGEEDYPLPFAKLRKENTCMPEPQYKDLKMHNGVWIDIFVYFGKPTNLRLKSIQEKMYRLFLIINRRKLDTIISENSKDDFEFSSKYKILIGLPNVAVILLKKLIYWLLCITECKKSEFVMDSWYLTPKTISVKRKYYEPTEKHIFVDREFKIPKNYDESLRTKYGDYMIPVVYENHTNYDNVLL